MIVKSRATFILLLLAFAPLWLEADGDDPNTVAGRVFGPDDGADTCDWSEGHIVAAPGVPQPTAPDHARLVKNLLLKLAARLVDDQQKTPDPQIKAIIDQSHLDNRAALVALTPAETQQTLVHAAFALLQAAKTDPLAAQVANEFQISEKQSPPPGGAPASPPSTNAPTAVAT